MSHTDSLAPILARWDERVAVQAPGVLDSCRIFHGRGGCYPGLEWVCVDLFWPVVLVTLFREPPSQFVGVLQQALSERMEQMGVTALLVQHRYLKEAPVTVAAGAMPDALFARRGALRFHLSLEQQNIGFFLDMEPGRQWLMSQCAGKRVLNLFAYTCSFSVIAQAGGAATVVNMDMSSRSLAVGRENHRLNNQSTANISFLAENILKSWGRLRRRSPFDIILIDPPSFQKGSFVAARDYGKLLRRIPQLAAPGAQILTCLNAPELDHEFLQVCVAEHCPDCQFVERLPAHPDFPDRQMARQLKLLVYRYQSH